MSASNSLYAYLALTTKSIYPSMILLRFHRSLSISLSVHRSLSLYIYVIIKVRHAKSQLTSYGACKMATIRRRLAEKLDPPSAPGKSLIRPAGWHEFSLGSAHPCCPQPNHLAPVTPEVRQRQRCKQKQMQRVMSK